MNIYLTGSIEDSCGGSSWKKEVGYAYKEYKADFLLPAVKSITMLNPELFNKEVKKIILSNLATIRNSVDLLFIRYDTSVLKRADVHGEMGIAAYFNIPIVAWLNGLTKRNLPSWDLGCIDFMSFELDKIVDFSSRLKGDI